MFAFRHWAGGLVCLFLAGSHCLWCRAADEDFRVDRGQKTFDFEGQEGGPFHSRRPHVPRPAPGARDQSGVTLGRGYDLKQRTAEEIKQDLLDAGLSDEQATAYAKGAGLSGPDAREFVTEHKEDALLKAATVLGLKGEEAEQYVSVNRLDEITPEQQRRLFEIVYPRYEEQVRKMFPDYDEFPQPAQEALVDMAYNIGPSLRRKFPNLSTAVESEDWASAAEESERGGIGARRNEATRQLFLDAQKEKERREAWPLKVGAFPTEYFVTSYRKNSPDVGELQGVFTKVGDAQKLKGQLAALDHVARVDIEVSPGTEEEFPEAAQRPLQAIKSVSTEEKSGKAMLEKALESFEQPVQSLKANGLDEFMAQLDSAANAKLGWKKVTANEGEAEIAAASELASRGYLVIGAKSGDIQGTAGVVLVYPSQATSWDSAMLMAVVPDTAGEAAPKTMIAADLIPEQQRSKFTFWAVRRRVSE